MTKEAPVARRVTWITIVLLLGAVLFGTAACTAGAASSTDASGQALSGPGLPADATPDQVQAGLGVKNIAQELVFMVDSSESMGPKPKGDGLYSAVQTALPDYITALHKSAPQDKVAVITFGRVGSARVVDPVGSPSPTYVLPSYTNKGSTDFGDAFKLALSLFNPLPKGMQAGGVILLSDGGNDPVGDPQYQQLGQGGWTQLSKQATALPVRVTGYALPLTENQGYQKAQLAALGAVFGGNVESMPNGTANLASALRDSESAITDGDVASAAQPDSGQGVAVSWPDLPSDPLAMRSKGSTPELTVTLKALTSKVPLYVTDLHLVAQGLQAKATWQQPPGTVTLNPGQSASLHFRLSWQPVSSGWTVGSSSGSASGRLVLTGTVGSTYQHALQSHFTDMRFSPGALHDATSDPVPAVTAVTDILLGLVIFVLVLAAAYLVIAYVTGMRGSLVLKSSAKVQGSLALGPFGLNVKGTSSLIGEHGRITVRKWPFASTMHIRLTLKGKYTDKDTVSPGNRTQLVGVDVVHLAPGQAWPAQTRTW